MEKERSSFANLAQDIFKSCNDKAAAISPFFVPSCESILDNARWVRTLVCEIHRIVRGRRGDLHELRFAARAFGLKLCRRKNVG